MQPVHKLLTHIDPCFSVQDIRPQDIDILVTNCSIYCPTPSLASMLVNQFHMRQDVQTYHLGGMGCGNGVMALSLIRDLLQVHTAGLDSNTAHMPVVLSLHCIVIVLFTYATGCPESAEL